MAGAGFLAAAPFGRPARAQSVAAASDPEAALKLLAEGNARYADNQQRDFTSRHVPRLCLTSRISIGLL